MYLRGLVLLLFSSLLMAQSQAPAPNSESKDSAASSQQATSSSKASDETKEQQNEGKPAGRVDDDDDMPNASKTMAEKSKLPADAPVITIEGVCDQSTGSAASSSSDASKSDAKSTPSSNCKTVVTREQFEKLADSLNPSMPPAVRRQLATAYPRLLLFSKKAREMGLDKEHRYQ